MQATSGCPGDVSSRWISGCTPGAAGGLCSLVAASGVWPFLCFPGFPEDFIDARGVLPLVFCHSSYGKSLAAERVGQQVLQGLHLVPLTFLRCLNDTRLQPTHVLVGGRPGDGVPAFLVVGGCTSSRMVSGVPPLRRVCRHLRSPLSQFAKRSRDERPDGSRLAFARDPVAWRLNPYPPRYRAAFASSILLYPQPLRLTLRFAFPCGETTGLPRSA